MATNVSSNDTGSERSSPGGALVTLLGVYAALYLAIVGALHFMTAPDATAAVVPEVTRQQIAAPALPAESFAGASDVSATALFDPEGPDNSSECTDGIDTSCIYN